MQSAPFSFPPLSKGKEFVPPGSMPLDLRNVWNTNLEEEMDRMMEAIEKYPYIAMDTEFPGVCYSGNDENMNIFEYNFLRSNVNRLKIIQLGITLCSQDGKIAEEYPTWQFNFHFDEINDTINKDSKNLLQNSGFDFNEHSTRGINPTRFSELLTMSGLVLNQKVRWISFHGDYDFAYLIKLLTGQDLPESKQEFDRILHIFFPHVYDVKFMLYDSQNISMGLNKLAEQLNIQRRGIMHQSGSDSRLTAETYFRMKEEFLHGNDDSMYDGFLCGTLDVHK